MSDLETREYDCTNYLPLGVSHLEFIAQVCIVKMNSITSCHSKEIARIAST
jgi:hypothetical protein